MSIPNKILPIKPQNWIAQEVVQFRSDASGFPLDRFYYGVMAEVSGRLAIGTADALAEAAESPLTFLERIHIYGQHRRRNEQTDIVDLRGASAFHKFGTIYRSRSPSNTGAMGLTTGDNDFRFFVPIIFPPQKISVLQQAGFLLDAPNYEWIQADFHMGDGNSVLDADATTTFTLTAFGSASGTPSIRLHRMIPNLRGERVGLITGLVRHYSRFITGSKMTTTATKVNLFDVRPGNSYRSFLLKTGVKTTYASAGFNAFASLSDGILSNLRFVREDIAQREYATFLMGREYLSEQYGVDVPLGYSGFDFSEFGDIRTVFDTAAFKKDNIDALIEADVVGAANQEMEIIIEEIVGGPIRAAVARGPKGR